MSPLMFYSICLLINTPVFLSSQVKKWSNKPQAEAPSSYDSIEILPYTPSKSDRTIVNEEIQDQDKLLTLFSNTTKEVKEAEEFLSEMLRVLHSLLTKQPNQDNTKTQDNQNGGSPQNIAWSYYDDVGK